MARRSTVPGPEEHARLWASLPARERRQIFRAVNRGEAMPTRKEARVAVGTARQQIRYWGRAWWFGPAVGIVAIPEWTTVVATAAAGTLMMWLLSRFRIRRARRAEQGNLERIGARGG